MTQALEYTTMTFSDESSFHDAADDWLEALFELLESEDVEARLDIDLQGGVMQIVTDEKTTIVISKHVPTHQLWLASPISGGLHFSALANGADWSLKDGRQLSVVLSEELHQLTGEEFSPNVV
jgi:iron donor protein CyaY